VREVAMSQSKPNHENRSTSVAIWLTAPLSLALSVSRLLIAAVLMIVAPILGAVLGVSAVTLALTACFFEWFSAVPDFPFWPMVGASVACATTRIAVEYATAIALKR
jgi:hypothetical protein